MRGTSRPLGCCIILVMLSAGGITSSTGIQNYNSSLLLHILQSISFTHGLFRNINVNGSMNHELCGRTF